MIPIDRWRPSAGLTLEPNALVAAMETSANLALTAGPGAGKTEMLAQRADFLLQTGQCRYPRRILAIAFKVDAARNLKARVRRRCGPELTARLDSHTFHAFAKRLIDRFRPVLKGRDALNADYSIGTNRVQGESITFGDLVPLAQTIINLSVIARNAVQQTYSHVLLDEFQDCTSDQYQLIKACFLGSPAILTAVGDTKQSIMGWAGALEGIFETFAHDFDARPLNLYQSFRSAPRLRRMQNAMIRVMDPPAASEDAELQGDEGTITVLQYATDEEEAEGLTTRVRAMIADSGLPASEIAILVSREQKFFCQRLMAAMDAANVPYREEDSTQDLASEPVAQLIVDFLLVVCGRRETAAHSRLLEQIVFSYGFDAEHEYQQRSRWSRLIADTRARIASREIDLSSERDLTDVAHTVIVAVGRDRIVEMSSDYAQGNRLDQLIADTIAKARALLVHPGDPTLALSRFSGDEGVRIMSIHKSKGLEFEAVIVLGVENEMFWSGIAKERSVYFVSISRARTHLLLTYCGQRARPPDFPRPRWDMARTPHLEFLGYAAAAASNNAA
ncbi:ATP-dependent helicase [Methylobacterium sp. E-045]|uniref:ATP-dependent helicase n=1 Tax=Methylobacterium sp. E-045 TaxID=2836575 RepID=UPI001FB90EC5|nr:ATP-dependent helicase [Methylobacterium sp. E-045]MCJ2132398.1 ATP-dependent helicase [Methylobacterium sp. E-045]